MPPATLQAPGQQNPLDNTMGSMFIGVLVSSCLYGISLVQTLYYYGRYPNDPKYLKWIVAFVIFMDTIHLIFTTHTIYYYLITKYYDETALTEIIWSVVVESLPTALTANIVQCFFAVRIWSLSKKSYVLAGTVVLSVFLTTGCGTAWLILSLKRQTYQQLLEISPLTITINALSAFTDVYIAVLLFVMLQRAKTGFKSSDSMIRMLTIFVVNTGLLTSLCAIGALVALVTSPTSLIYASFYFCIGRLYTNSLLASLNARRIIRGIATDMDHFTNSAPERVLSPRSATGSRTQNISIRIDTQKDFLVDQKIATSSVGDSMTMEMQDSKSMSPTMDGINTIPKVTRI